MTRRLTLTEFIDKANKIHDNKYNYSLVNYVNRRTKVKIICPISGHGVFEQEASSHLKGAGCPKCAGHIQSNTEEFNKKAKAVHDDLYDYSLVEYINAKTKVNIICPISGHGPFEQAPNHHLKGAGIEKINPSQIDYLQLNCWNQDSKSISMDQRYFELWFQPKF